MKKMIAALTSCCFLAACNIQSPKPKPAVTPEERAEVICRQHSSSTAEQNHPAYQGAMQQCIKKYASEIRRGVSW